MALARIVDWRASDDGISGAPLGMPGSGDALLGRGLRKSASANPCDDADVLITTMMHVGFATTGCACMHI